MRLGMLQLLADRLVDPYMSSVLAIEYDERDDD